MYRDKDILTFYGIRKCESVNRSKYNRIEDDAESIKIQKQTVGYQIKKYNACRRCLKCESLCRYGAISIIGGDYHISSAKCKPDEELYEDYVRGGVDVLYEKLIESANSEEDYLKNLYDFMEDFDERYGQTASGVLDLVKLARS
jgi:ferredoxin